MAKGPLGVPRPIADAQVAVRVKTSSSLGQLPTTSFKDEVEYGLDGSGRVHSVSGREIIIIYPDNPSVDELESVVLAVERGSENVGMSVAVESTEVFAK